MARLTTVTWSDGALDDLDAVCLFIARDASPYARLFARDVFDAAETLIEWPRRGRVVPELGREDIRELILFGTYRLVYRLLGDDEEAEILTLHHGAQPLRVRLQD